MESKDEITVRTAGGELLKLVRKGHLVATRPRGQLGLAECARSLRYELSCGEPVQVLCHNLWLHPSTGEELRFVGFGVLKSV